MAIHEDNFSLGKEFGARLCSLRKKRGFTQSELAQKLGYKTSASVSNIESGAATPNIVTLTKIAAILSIDLHWLITGTASPAVKRLKPFAVDHFALREKEMTNLRSEGAELGIRESMGEPTGLRRDQIAEEIENRRGYCVQVRKSLNEVLDDIGESI